MIKAGAIVVGDRSGSGAAVFDVAAELGFAYVEPHSDALELPVPIEDIPICFVLFADLPDPRDYRPVVQEIRHGQPHALAFAPFIYFSERPSHEVFNNCIAIGMDDIVSTPFTEARVREKLMRQIETPQVYYQTSNYFGPDRRRLSKPRLADAFLRGLNEVHEARRYEIRRNLNSGVTILREQTVRSGGRGAA